MNTQQTNAAHSLYVLYETLPRDVQKTFLEELVQKKHLEIEAIASSGSSSNKKYNTVVLGVMEDAFTVPDSFDESLPEDIVNGFYADKL